MVDIHRISDEYPPEGFINFRPWSVFSRIYREKQAIVCIRFTWLIISGYVSISEKEKREREKRKTKAVLLLHMFHIYIIGISFSHVTFTIFNLSFFAFYLFSFAIASYSYLIRLILLTRTNSYQIFVVPQVHSLAPHLLSSFLLGRKDNIGPPR